MMFGINSYVLFQALSILSEAKIEDERKRNLLLDEFSKAKDFFEATECETLTAFAASEYNHNFRGDDATYQPTQSEGILYSCCR